MANPKWKQRRSNVTDFRRHKKSRIKSSQPIELYILALILMALTFGGGMLAIGRFSVASTPSISEIAGEHFSCRVSSVHDGDTLRCSDGTRVRLHAVAARELDETCSPGHPCPAATGAAAKYALTDLALGKTLDCEPTGTTYNRIAAICTTPENLEINCAMVERGYAVIWEKFNRQVGICRN